jgi:phosphoribosyl-AMP cyclohydrolase
MSPTPDIEAILSRVTFNARGLVPVIAQHYASGDVLMMAWMNRDAIAETLTTRRVCYWSRSRQALWRKGETSGHTQALKDFIKVDQVGPACHTGEKTCFFNKI